MPAALCRAARSPRELGLWERLIAEHQRQNFLWIALAVACLAAVIVAFLWPHLGL